MEATSSTHIAEIQKDDADDKPVIPAALKFVISNIKIIVPAQLTSDNYPIWRSQVLKLLNANGFFSFLLPTATPPASHKTLSTGSKVPNPKHQEWVLIDQNLAAALCSTLSPAILPYVIHLTSTSEIWSALERRLQSSNRSRVIQLKNELHTVQMKSQTMAQYLQQNKTIVDNIVSAGAILDQEDVLLYTLNRLPPSYNALKTTIRAMQTPMDLENLYSLLITEEINLQSESLRQLNFSDSSTALYSHRGRGQRGRVKPSSQPARTSNTPIPQCQICNKKGHSAHNCWHRLNTTVNPPDTTAPNPQSRALVAATDSNNHDWYLNTGASAHLTNSMENLSQATSYNGPDNITVGDGRSLSITHTGNGILPTPYRKLKLNSLFHVPNLSHNLLSVSNLTQDNNVSVNFNPSGFTIKDMKTNRTILSGPSNRGLYPVRSATTFVFPKKALTATSQAASLWHQRLGHTNSRIIQAISTTNKNLHIPHNFSFCSECTTSKGHKLAFTNNRSHSTMPLEIIHTDVWGPAPVP
ncbi:Retrovirus-related Pol polyprotein from transposon TNT 1-94 [Dendrobium catenatum]|uniref:Retrovirus-related Pol polyprotein from transposon TNT 1-94 n=1 Tax=Dendrobium catenatum TaxID=906689 RepID=A0A2I0WZ94_9ASPA|nr:Retrovirus-related Pol polyprotein from transposon TNT 1-94 [Dendrobium catenatum]